MLGPDSNDDHPPSDVLAGQDLVLTLYHALSYRSNLVKDAVRDHHIWALERHAPVAVQRLRAKFDEHRAADEQRKGPIR